MEFRAGVVHRLAVVLISCLAMSSVEANYTLEILIESYQNPTHQALELATSQLGCCDLDPVLPCKACDNAFRVCIREESTGIAQGGCSIAEVTTSLMAAEDDNLMFSLGDDIGELSNPLVVSGDEWPGSVEIVFTVYDLDGPTTIEPSSDVVDTIIVHPTISAVPSLSDLFTDTIDYYGTYSSLQLAFRLTCGPDHYGPDCTFCKETNDSSGHFSCNKTVGKVCLEGYQNPQTNCVECSPSADCICPTATVTSTATVFIFRTETGPDLTVPECIVPTTVTAPTPTPAPEPSLEVRGVTVIDNTVEVTVRLTGAKQITVILRDVNNLRWTRKVQGSSASALFTDVVSGPIWIRAVGRGADGMKHHTEWLSFTVE